MPAGSWTGKSDQALFERLRKGKSFVSGGGNSFGRLRSEFELPRMSRARESRVLVVFDLCDGVVIRELETSRCLKMGDCDSIFRFASSDRLEYLSFSSFRTGRRLKIFSIGSGPY